MDDTTRRKVQLVELEILDEITQICEKYNIVYYLVYGTLLGAIRHKGFIPWDDDIDIAMPREEYNKFKEICKIELDNNYFLQSSETEPLYWNSHNKVRKNNTLFVESEITHIKNVHKGIFVDIFILDHSSKQESVFQDVQAFLFKVIQGMITHKTLNLSKSKASLKQRIIGFFSIPFKLELLLKLREKIMTINNDKHSKYFFNLGCIYGHKKTTMPKDVYYPPVKVEFEGKLYNAPNNCDYYLKRIFGNYWELPPEEQRVGHNPERVFFEMNDGNEVVQADGENQVFSLNHFERR